MDNQSISEEMASRGERCADMRTLPYPEIGAPAITYILEKDTLLSNCWYGDHIKDVTAPKGAAVILRQSLNWGDVTYNGVTYRY